MKYNKTVTLKDDSECLLRNAKASDARQLLESTKITHGETDFLTGYPDEYDGDINKESEALRAKEESENQLELCAFLGDILAGSASITQLGQKYKIRHRAKFGISVEKRF
jgi:hypothetical protein